MERNHPLISVLKKYDRHKHIVDVGARLYGTLSTNIRHFSGQFDVLNDQWNVLEANMLKALKPLIQNEKNTDIEWEDERQRY